jgi:hypothetical protein
MLSCRHVTCLLSARLDRRLGWLESICLAVHLLGCKPCRRFRRATGWLHQALPAATEEVELPAEARERVRRALELFQSRDR